MEDILKSTVVQVLKERLGQAVEISRSEWEDAKRETMNDVYANKCCFFQNVTSDYFISTMVGIIVLVKKA